MPRKPRQSTPNRASRHIDATIEDPYGELQAVKIHIGESPLLWLRSRGLLSERLFLAGDRLRQDWELAGLGPRVTMAWDAAPPSRGSRSHSHDMPLHAHQMSARQRLEAALNHAGPGLKDILWRVVCAGEGLMAAEQALGWPNRAAKLVLGFALERVADYYRIT
ncbi:MAG: DUF6456 domain-containing protein [Sphingobium sp.]